MKTSELVFVGIGRSVVALNRATGEKVWATRLKGYDFVNVVLDGGRLFATCCGEISSLDPVTGSVLWHNPLKGFGTGLATIATEQAIGSGLTAVLAEKQRQDQAAAAVTTTVSDVARARCATRRRLGGCPSTRQGRFR
jgi:outer membrane protein assembly factor BamB